MYFAATSFNADISGWIVSAGTYFVSILFSDVSFASPHFGCRLCCLVVSCYLASDSDRSYQGKWAVFEWKPSAVQTGDEALAGQINAQASKSTDVIKQVEQLPSKAAKILLGNYSIICSTNFVVFRPVCTMCWDGDVPVLFHSLKTIYKFHKYSKWKHVSLVLLLLTIA